MGVESEGLRPTSVMIVDDQRYARLGLALMIRKAPDLHVVAEAGDGQEALEALERLNRSTGLPDVVLMDVRMPGMDGISATRAVARRFPTVKVLVLTTYDEDDYAFGALEVGASGFLLKDVRAAQLAQAVRAVAQGDAVLTPRVTKEL
ncbi:response regulator transcription factor, partial [Actinomyces oris]